jgi:predicted transcriptional regulator
MGIPKKLGLCLEEWVNEYAGGYSRLSISDRREAVLEMATDGMTQREIAGVLGVTQPTISNDLNSDKNLSHPDNPPGEDDKNASKPSTLKPTKPAVDVAAKIVKIISSWSESDETLQSALDIICEALERFDARRNRTDSPAPAQEPTPAPATPSAPVTAPEPEPIAEEPPTSQTAPAVKPEPRKQSIVLPSVSEHVSDVTCPQCADRLHVRETREKVSGKKELRFSCACTAGINGIKMARTPTADFWQESLFNRGLTKQEAVCPN